MKQAQPKQPKQQHQRGFHHWHKICALTTETTQILEYSYSNFNQFQKIHIQPISYISCITNLCISSIPKTCMCIDEQFRTFHPSLHESVTHFLHLQFCAFHQSQKPLRVLINNFVHFIHPYMNLLPKMVQNDKTLSHSVSQESYFIWFSFWCTCVKWEYLH